MAKGKLLSRQTRKGWDPKDVAVKMWKILGVEKIWDLERIWLQRVNGHEGPSVSSSFVSFYT